MSCALARQSGCLALAAGEQILMQGFGTTLGLRIVGVGFRVNECGKDGNFRSQVSSTDLKP